MIFPLAPTNTVDERPVKEPAPMIKPWLVLLKNAPWIAGPLIVL